MEPHLKIIGFLLVALAASHSVFPRYFNWRQELQNVSLITRQIFFVHTFFIALAVFLMGLLCLTCAPDLAGTVLGRRIVLGLSAFWFCRFLVQLFGYSSKIWRGKSFETAVHIGFSLFWAYMSTVFLLVGLVAR